ncbi:DUF4177 domain-containing protein [Celeribacter indicus]|uniref:DUF4177 domain-containing protein n=1 Tax=Celeribacter indicus TaxID=1208324 RepID=A0A0B5E6E7_9RHOB|nr:DUF4177 domain-containing protein [Celeribacter indicus]AJE47897.1 hypothetical protein P73_3182 [Celeribacter indicus]SDW26339.1 protein of unknown function [Celeribacter indicus]
MPFYEYLTVPAPRRGEKNKGAKTPEARAAQAMQTVLNEKGAEGWEYVRADLLPTEERAGIASKTVNYHTVLVFRRERDGEAAALAATLRAGAETADLRRRGPVADRDTPPPSVPFPAKAEKGAGSAASRVAPEVADELAEDRES